jgi:hypothetical protein
MNRVLVATVFVSTLAGAAALVACGSDTPPPKTAKSAPGGSTDQSKWPADDRSLCEQLVHWRNHPEFEVSETAGPGAFRPNVRRIYKVVGERESRHKVLVCRELDLNLDGIKDVVRTFNEKGEAKQESADSNYDGKIDVQTDFSQGRITKQEEDTNFDGHMDVWKFYIDGLLSRVRRNTHCANFKPDTWEIYNKGILERVGNDTNCDTHVDRWDRDTERIRLQEEEERKTLEKMQQAAAADAGMTVAPDGGLALSGDGGTKPRP